VRANGRWRGAARPAPIVLALAAMLSGCGQTGPLYLPDDENATVITRPGPATTGNESSAPPASTAADAPDAPAAAPSTPADKPPAKR